MSKQTIITDINTKIIGATEAESITPEVVGGILVDIVNEIPVAGGLQSTLDAGPSATFQADLGEGASSTASTYIGALGFNYNRSETGGLFIKETKITSGEYGPETSYKQFDYQDTCNYSKGVIGFSGAFPSLEAYRNSCSNVSRVGFNPPTGDNSFRFPSPNTNCVNYNIPITINGCRADSYGNINLSTCVQTPGIDSVLNASDIAYNRSMQFSYNDGSCSVVGGVMAFYGLNGQTAVYGAGNFSLACNNNSLSLGTDGIGYYRGDTGTSFSINYPTIGSDNSTKILPLSVNGNFANNAGDISIDTTPQLKTINGEELTGSGNISISAGAAQVNSDWTANSGVSQIVNKPTLLDYSSVPQYNVPFYYNNSLLQSPMYYRTYSQYGSPKNSISINAAAANYDNSIHIKPKGDLELGVYGMYYRYLRNSDNNSTSILPPSTIFTTNYLGWVLAPSSESIVVKQYYRSNSADDAGYLNTTNLYTMPAGSVITAVANFQVNGANGDGLNTSSLYFADKTSGNIYSADNTTYNLTLSANNTGFSDDATIATTQTEWYMSNFANNNVIKVVKAGGVKTILGTTGAGPTTTLIDSLGNIYTLNKTANTISKITQSGVTTTIYSGGSTIISQLIMDANDNMYISCTNSDYIFMMNTSGTVLKSRRPNAGNPSSGWFMLIDKLTGLFYAIHKTSRFHKFTDFNRAYSMSNSYDFYNVYDDPNDDSANPQPAIVNYNAFIEKGYLYINTSLGVRTIRLNESLIVATNTGAIDISNRSGWTGDQSSIARYQITPNGLMLNPSVDAESMETSHGSTLVNKDYIKRRIGTVAPASATAPGKPGDIRITSTYIYTCVAPNTWVRAAVATW